MTVYYHKNDCSGTDEFGLPVKFVPAVCKNKAGFYVGMECFTCHVNTRESGYYTDEPTAWSDYNLMLQGLPITNPREEETEEEVLTRHLKAAGFDPKPDDGNDWSPVKQARVVILPTGAVDIELEDPLGAKLHIRLHITPWGLLGITDTGFGSVVTEDGYLVIMPDSDHTAESQNGLIDSMAELSKAEEEVQQGAPTIDAESIL